MLSILDEVIFFYTLSCLCVLKLAGLLFPNWQMPVKSHQKWTNRDFVSQHHHRQRPRPILREALCHCLLLMLGEYQTLLTTVCLLNLLVRFVCARDWHNLVRGPLWDGLQMTFLVNKKTAETTHLFSSRGYFFSQFGIYFKLKKDDFLEKMLIYSYLLPQLVTLICYS